jgi:DNA replication protein DnaC
MAEKNVEKLADIEYTVERPPEPYTKVLNDVVQNVKQPDALAIWTFLQSKSGNWKVIGGYLQDHFGIGRQRYAAAMKYLSEHGLITYVPRRSEDGRMMGTRVIVHYTPKINAPSLQVSDMSVSPTLGKTHPYDIKDSITKEKDLTKRSADANRIDEAFESFWKMGMRKHNKVAARKAFARQAKGKDLDDFLAMLAKDVETRIVTGQQGFTEMHPSTYLNNQRWEDERSDCPHRRILEAWHEVMPSHIAKPTLSDWLNMDQRQRLTETWEKLKVRKRRGSDRMVIEDEESGVEFMRGMMELLAPAPRIQSPEDSSWCTFGWFSKFESIIAIGTGQLTGEAA